MKTTLARGIALSFSIATFAAVAQEPVTLKDFQMGADLHSEAQRAGLECHKVSTGEMCSQWDNAKLSELARTIADVPASRLYLSGIDGKLGRVSFTVEAPFFNQVKTAFMSKYPTMLCTDSTVQSRVGAKFGQTTCDVADATAKLQILRRSDTLTQSSITLISAEYENALAGAAKQRAQAAKKDI